ncbi:MAG: hypothetical protein ACYS1A_20195, partial [Planctomycetota bacterium]
DSRPKREDRGSKKGAWVIEESKMKKNKFRYAKKKIHKRGESLTHTACGIRFNGTPALAFDWRDVTCKNCLQTKKDHDPR